MGIISLLAGCAGPAEVGKMVVKEKKYSPHRSVFFRNLSIGNVNVRDEYRSLASSKVSPEVLREALQMSLQNNHFLADHGHPKYKIDVTLDLTRDFKTSYDTTVSVYVGYKISKVNDENEDDMFEETILSVCTKPVNEGLTSTLSVQAATEGAIKKNIQMLIQRISNISHLD